MNIKLTITGLIMLCFVPWVWPIATALGVVSESVKFAIAMNASLFAFGGIATLAAGLLGGFPK